MQRRQIQYAPARAPKEPMLHGWARVANHLTSGIESGTPTRAVSRKRAQIGHSVGLSAGKRRQKEDDYA